MIEVEIKVRLTEDEFNTLPSKLDALGFAMDMKVQEIDDYFNGIDRNFAVTDEAFRIRTTKYISDDRVQSYVTYKGKKLDNISKTRIEYETGIEDYDSMKNILICLGFKAASTVDKIREYYSNGNMHICFDNVKKVGHFMELESVISDEAEKQAALEELFSILHKLEISRSKLERRSYLEMFILISQNIK